MPKLCSSTDLVTKSSSFFNPDLTQIERQEGFAFGSELNQCKAAGEVDIDIRKGAIVKLPAPTAPRSRHPAQPSPLSLVQSISSLLHASASQCKL